MESGYVLAEGVLEHVMRRLALPVALVIALASAAGAAASPVFVLRGEGWGHGVGMSQYGALGRAAAGQGYKQILGFYYDGTNVGETSQGRVRVLLMEKQSAVTIRSSEDFEFGDKKLARFTDWKIVPASDGMVRVVGKGRFAGPVTASPTANAFLRMNGLRYRGDLRIFNRGGSLAVVNVVGMQGYLYSVVPREMPASWPLGALKAQAVAARSYAARAHRASWFDLYDDTRDQVYGGLDYSTGEEPGSTQAVNDSAGEVVTYNGAVAATYFSSTNGGRTAASVDTWGGSLPYLISKSDPLDLNGSNPYRAWTVVLSPRALQKRLGAAHQPLDAIVTSRASGRVNRVRLDRGSWSQTFPSSGLGPEYFRSALGLRSSRFDFGVLDLTPSTTKSVCNARVRLNLLVREVHKFTLQRMRSGGSWTNMSVQRLDAAHYYAIDKPCRRTSYRLRSGSTSTAVATVKVAPKIVFAATQPATDGLRGIVRPVSLVGETVHVDRRHNGSWIKNVGTAAVRSDGKWRAHFDSVAGTYRARIAPPSSTGLVPGISPLLNFN
jgi:SpoIID/LytB domain protein